MDINAIHNYASGTAASAAGTSKAGAKTTKKTDTADTGVIYEKSSSSSTGTNNKTQNAALIAQMKADTNNRVAQLRGIVEQMMSKQGVAIGKADDMWAFLAGGNYTVSAETKAQAQQDISEDGYWGVKQTSDRIVDFAKALSGGDKSKAEELLNAFKKGFQQATKSWGKTLPEISQKTYDAVLEKFDAWVNEEN